MILWKMCVFESEVLFLLTFMSITAPVWGEDFIKIKPRAGRFLSFDTSIDGDIDVDLDFTIPFIKIPIKKTMDSMFGSNLAFPTINVNVVGLALGGIVILGSAVILPFLTKIYSVPETDGRDAKVLDQSNFKADAILEFSNKLLASDNGIHECTLKLACLAGHQATGSTTMYVLEQIARNNLLSNILNTTEVDNALQEGGKGFRCAQSCPLKDEQLKSFLTHFSGLYS